MKKKRDREAHNKWQAENAKPCPACIRVNSRSWRLCSKHYAELKELESKE